LGSLYKGSCILIFEEGKGFLKPLTTCSDFGFEVSWAYLLRDLGQNLKSSHQLAKNLEIKIKLTVILPVRYGYGRLREQWRGGV